MGFLAAAVAAILSITTPIIQEIPLHIRHLQSQICPFGPQASWLLQNSPVDILPPKPTFPGSSDLYDSENRTDSYNPSTYPTFERILLPLNTMNIFGQNITKLPTNPTCQLFYMNVVQRWAANQALTGRVNSYSILLHRITTGDIAQNYLAVAPAVPLAKARHRAIRTWLTTLNQKITARPSPYQNNFRLWDFRSLVATAYADYKPTLPYLSQIQVFLQSVIRPDGIISSEIRGARSIQYHIYFLAPLFDTLYIIFTDTSGRRLQARHINLVEGVVRNLERSLTDPSIFFMAASFTEQMPTNQETVRALRARWNCVAVGLRCRENYAGLLSKLAGRRFI
jgi:hypothetical protein